MKKIVSFLEKKSSVDLRYIVKNGSWLASSQTVSTASSLVLAIVFANILSPETFGLYKYVLSIFSLFLITSLNGINTSLLRTTAKGGTGTLIPAAKLRIKYGLLGTIIAVITAIIFIAFEQNLIGYCILALSPFIPFYDSFTVYDSFLTGKQNFKYSTKLFILSQISVLLTTLGLIFISQNIILLTFFYGFSWTLARLLCYRHIIKKYAESEVKENLEPLLYGKHLSLMNVLATISFHMDKILLFNFVGSINLALYSIAIAPVQHSRSGNKILASMIIPRFSKRTASELRLGMPRKVLLLFLLSVFAFLLYFLISPYIFKIFFPNYLDAIIYSQVYALVLIFTPRLLFQQALTAMESTRSLYIIQTVIPVMKILFLLILIPILGIWGVMLAILITELLSTFMSWYYFKLSTKEVYV